VSERDARLYLSEMILSCGRVADYIQELDGERFRKTELYQDAVIRNLEIIGEAASKLPNNLRTRYQEVPWKGMIGFRNIAIHAYFAVDFANVWHIASQSLPELASQLQQILDDLGGLAPQEN